MSTRCTAMQNELSLRHLGVAWHESFTSLYLRDGRVLIGGRDGRRGLVTLARRPVQRHDPQVALVLVVAGQQHAVALLYGVEEVPPALKVRCKVSSAPSDRQGPLRITRRCKEDGTYRTQS